MKRENKLTGPITLIDKASIISLWLEGHSFSKIGEEGMFRNEISNKQFLTTLFAKELLVLNKDGIISKWVKKQSVDERGDSYPYLDFSGYKYGKLYALFAKKLGYTMLLSEWCVHPEHSELEDGVSITYDTIKALVHKKIREVKGLPCPYDYIEKGKIGFYDALFFAEKGLYSGLFCVSRDDENEESRIVGLCSSSIALTIMKWLQLDDTISVKEVLENLPQSYFKKKEVEGIDEYRRNLYYFRKPLYIFPPDLRKRMWEFIGEGPV